MSYSSRICLLGSLSAVGLLALAGGCDGDESTDNSSTSSTSTSSSSSSSSGSTGGGGTGGTTSGGGGGGMGGSAGGAGGVGGAGGSGGAGGGGGSQPSQQAYYRGDFDTDGVDQVGSIEWPGPNQAVLQPTGLTGGDEINSIALSPDGLELAIAGRDTANDTSVLNVYAPDGTGTPTTIVAAANVTNTAAEFTRLAYSPDGNWIAYVGALDIAGVNAVYVSPSDGTTVPKAVSQVPNNTQLDASTIAWAADSTHLVYTGDLDTHNVTGIWSVDTSATTPVPVPLVPLNLLSNNNEIAASAQFDSTGKVYFISSHTAGTDYLFRCDMDGQNLEVVPGTDLQNGGGQAEVGAWAISPDGLTVAFAADSPAAALLQVYVMPLSGTTSTVVSNVQATAPNTGTRGPVWGHLIWSPDGTMIAAVSDWEVNSTGEDNDFAAFLLPSSGSAGGVRIVQPSVADDNQDVGAISFTSDSARLVIMGDLVANNATEIYSTDDLTTADQSVQTIRVEEVPSGGDVDGILVP
ncbi:MAG: hypothetical protein DRI90_21895 [Deltaproteobacteria bacterium]|nr:MAG: hypothetical protein DRI90_21895 [Deltaproteobacteria bacterium]